jgi:hypothetical protein
MTLQNNDLLIIGRGQQSYSLTYNEVKSEITADVVQLVEDEETRATAAELQLQANVDAEAAARAAGDDAEKARSEAADVALQANIDAEVAARIAGDAAEKNRAEASELTLQANIDAEEARAKAAEQAISDALSQEAIDRGNGDDVINTRIDELVLGDLFNVTVGGATDNQVLYYNEAAGEWQAKVVTLSSSLNYAGDIDLTAAAPVATAGDLFINTATTGSVDDTFGVEVTAALPNGVSGGEFVAFNGTDWAYVGSIGGGLTYDSFTVNNATETTGSKGELSYNSSNGTFTFTKVDLDSKIPKDLSTLDVLPA